MGVSVWGGENLACAEGGEIKRKARIKKQKKKQKAEEELRRKRVAVTRWIRESNEFEGVLSV